MLRRPLVLLFAGALILRLVVLFTGPWADPTRIYTFSPDSPRYVALADALRTHQAFGKPTEDGLMHLAVEKLRRENGTLPSPDANGLYNQISPGVFEDPYTLARTGATSP